MQEETDNIFIKDGYNIIMIMQIADISIIYLFYLCIESFNTLEIMGNIFTIIYVNTLMIYFL